VSNKEKQDCAEARDCLQVPFSGYMVLKYQSGKPVIAVQSTGIVWNDIFCSLCDKSLIEQSKEFQTLVARTLGDRDIIVSLKLKLHRSEGEDK